MGYFVIGENGELYGPADITTLNEWIAQGRIAPTTMIQEELGGARFAASLLKDLNFGENYPQTYSAQATDRGDSEFKIAWIMGVLGLFCCSFCGPIGIFYAFSAKKKGHAQATAALVFCSLITLISIVWTIFYLRMGGIEGILRELGLPSIK